MLCYAVIELRCIRESLYHHAYSLKDYRMKGCEAEVQSIKEEFGHFTIGAMGC